MLPKQCIFLLNVLVFNANVIDYTSDAEVALQIYNEEGTVG